MKPAVVYSLLATAFLFILAFSPKPQKGHYSQLRLGRCLGCKHLIFDPLVAKMERSSAEENWSEKDQHDLENYYKSQIKHDWDTNPFSDIPEEDPEDYFSEKGQLNIPGRLLVLFPCLDKTPKDGVISFKELEAWNVWQATNRLNQRTLREMKEHDLDGDKFITLREYLPNLFDNDNIEDKFAELDVNMDKYLTVAELRPLTHHLNPGELSYAKYFTKYLIRMADDDRDGTLSLNEMLNHPHIFYSTVIHESELADDDYTHEELR